MKKGSSPNSGKDCTDLQEEVRVVTVSVGDALDDLDLVVDPLDQVCPKRPPAVCQDAWKIGLQTAEKDTQQLQPASQSAILP